MVCHALRLECVKSIDSTASVHLALIVPARDVVLVEATWDVVLRFT